MNIFYLSNNTKKCAMMHNDKHVVKMILEYAQLLSTAHHELDGDVSAVFYKPTHKNHPSAKWARDNINNYGYIHSFVTCVTSTHIVIVKYTKLTQGYGLLFLCHQSTLH